MTKLETAEWKIDQVVNSPCASDWLRNALSSAVKGDPVDRLHDAKYLVTLLQARLDALKA